MAKDGEVERGDGGDGMWMDRWGEGGCVSGVGGGGAIKELIIFEPDFAGRICRPDLPAGFAGRICRPDLPAGFDGRR